MSRFFDVRYKQNIDFEKLELKIIAMKKAKFGNDKEFLQRGRESRKKKSNA